MRLKYRYYFANSFIWGAHGGTALTGGGVPPCPPLRTASVCVPENN